MLAAAARYGLLALTLTACGACGGAATAERAAEAVAFTHTSGHDVAPSMATAAAHVTTERRTLQVDHCTFDAQLPRVTTGNAANDARIADALETALEGWTGVTSQSGCTQAEAQGEVGYSVDLDAHGLVALSLTYPLTPMQRFSIPSPHAFVLATGEELTSETLFRPERSDAFAARFVRLDIAALLTAP